MHTSRDQPFAKKLRVIFNVRTLGPLAKKNYTNCWIPAKKGIGIARTGCIKITMAIRWGYVFAIREQGMRRLRF